jgi:4-amino-4-deoxy-L-arabinose transferase-like glycosyltransferase
MTTSETMDANTNPYREMGKFEANVWFWSVVGFFVTAWALFSILFNTGYKGDAMEMQLIAKEWVLSTRKLPCLPSWILEFLNILTHRSFAVPFIASALCALLALWSVWQLGRTVLNERLALIGAFVLLPYPFFSTRIDSYNHNTVLIAFWCLSIYLVWQAFQTNKKRYWISAGITLGLTFHAKFSAVFLVIAILVYMFMRKEGRVFWRSPGPYMTTVIAFFVFLPQLVWLFHYDFAPLAYMENRPVLRHWYQQVLAPLSFAVAQLGYLYKPLVILIPVIGLVWKWKVQHHEEGQAKECEKFLFYCFMIPLVCHMLICGIKGVHLRPSYGAPFWIFGGLWLSLRFQQIQKDLIRCFRQVVVLTISIGMLFLAGESILWYCAIGQNNQKIFPMRELGATCEQIWSSRFDSPCLYTSGEWYLAGSAAHAMKDRPSVHYYFGNIADSKTLPTGTWSTDEDVNQKGGMILWEISQSPEQLVPDWVHRRFPRAEVLPEILDLPYKSRVNISPLTIGIAIIPPRDPCCSFFTSPTEHSL